jgi:hypothetical protein
VADLIAAWTKMADNEIMEHASIEKIISEKRDEQKGRYQGIVQKPIKKFLAETRVLMVNVLGVGYQRTTGVQQMEASQVHARRGVRRIKFSCRVLAEIGDDRLPDEHNRMVRNKRLERMNLLSEMAQQETRAINMVLKPKELPASMRIVQ